MPLIVQKFGGTSVAGVNNICKVADKIAATMRAGNQIIVVVSAMAGATDELNALAQQITNQPDPRELDVLLASGEQVTIALLTIALRKIGCKAKSYTGSQVKIQTDSVYNKARIIHIDPTHLQHDLANGYVVVVAGFQGVDALGNITTLGRGGSDTTAVALAAVLQADECQIYTDVDGVYTVDPRMIADAKRLPAVNLEEMLELSSLGNKVLQLRAVEFAGNHHVPVRILSTFAEDATGTLISTRKNLTKKIISGVTYSQNEVKITLHQIQNYPGIIGKILEPLSAANIEIDMLTVNLKDNVDQADLTFSLQAKDLVKTREILNNLGGVLDKVLVVITENIAKVSLVGIGLRSYPWIASKMFQILGIEGVNIQLISTSEIKVSVLIDEKYLKKGVNALHKAFDL